MGAAQGQGHIGEDADFYRPERRTDNKENAGVMGGMHVPGAFQDRGFVVRSVLRLFTGMRKARRRRPCLHRPGPGAAGDQQGHPSSAEGSPLRALAP
ncbi:hypothetical protein DL763_009129 [Monosporascus cannonballus]|nr:hypothetical protein DL763_009129 [Monosporascus cannonballus]